MQDPQLITVRTSSPDIPLVQKDHDAGCCSLVLDSFLHVEKWPHDIKVHLFSKDWVINPS